MVSSIRHIRNGRAQRSTSRATNSSDAASQRVSAGHCSSRSSRRISAATGHPSSVQPGFGQPPKKRGRKQACETKLVYLPPRGPKVLLEPLGDMQFTYVNYHEARYKYTSQLGVILKREYPGLVTDKDQHGVVIRTRPALDWSDYFLSIKDIEGLTKGDRVISEFWDEYTTKCKAAHPEEDEADAEHQELDEKVLYDISGGMRHGRLAIANGAVRKVDVMSVVKEKSAVPLNSASYRHLAKDNRHLRHANRCLQERLDQMGDLTNDLILDLYSQMKKEVPANLKSRLAALRAPNDNPGTEEVASC